jgi:hypothetical protein
MKNNGLPSDFAIALNWDGSLVFVIDQRTGKLSIWNVDTLSLMNSDNFQKQESTDIIFNITGNLVISGDVSGKKVAIWGFSTCNTC